MIQLSEHLYLYRDTCNVYIVKHETKAVLIDFGSGDVLDGLQEIGVEQVEAVLMTHHHRDQGQGLARAAEAGIPIWVPHAEQELFAEIDAHWQAREIYNNYNVRQDRFSLLQPVPIAGTLKDYETRIFAGVLFTVFPTPGHTIGSISLLCENDEKNIAFTGDLIYGAGKLWSLAATHWSYDGGEGIAYSIASLSDLQECGPDVLLPSHGEPIDRPAQAMEQLQDRLLNLLQFRDQHQHLLKMQQQPFEEITPHLLRNRSSFAYHYILISKSGKALFFDFGYDFMMGLASGWDRAARRPWLHTLTTLKKKYGVKRVDTVVPTHYHDDHIAGINLLRDKEGAQVWAAETFADILRKPAVYDLPCLWYDPVPVDRELPISEPIQWEEYEFTLYPVPGHTLYAVAIALEVDGERILISGDQYRGGEGVLENYVYPNRFRIRDYIDSAALYKSLQPEVILTGHWMPLRPEEGYFDELIRRGEELERLHRELLPLEETDFGAEGFGVRLEPYQTEVCTGEAFELQAEVKNPYSHQAEAEVRLIMPSGWNAKPEQFIMTMAAHAMKRITFEVTPSGAPARRERIAADLNVDGNRFGQQAEALVTLRNS